MTPSEFRDVFDRLGLTEAELAEAAGVSRGTIAKAKARGIERGSLPTLMRLLDAHPELVDEARRYNEAAE